MPDAKARLLIVDDEPSVRTSLSMVLAEIGYSVRSAEGGFSALAEIRNEIPDILLSDLNMPDMSGFELLSVVHHRFPSIQTIAMSGAFSGVEVPSGIHADAFYPKGSDARSLLMIIERLAQRERLPAYQPPRSALLFIQRSGNDADGRPYVSIACPECLRTFCEFFGDSPSLVREAHCAHCRNPISYAIVDPIDHAPAPASRRSPLEAEPARQYQSPY